MDKIASKYKTLILSLKHIIMRDIGPLIDGPQVPR